MNPSTICCESGMKLILPNSKGMIFISIDEVLYFESDNIYTYLIAPDLSKQTILCSIKDIENSLCQEDKLIRIHKKFVVNVDRIEMYCKSEGGYVMLQNDIQLPVSRHRKEEFKNKLGI